MRQSTADQPCVNFNPKLLKNGARLYHFGSVLDRIEEAVSKKKSILGGK